MCSVQKSLRDDSGIPEGVLFTGIFWTVVRIWAGRILLGLGLVLLAGYAAARIEGLVAERIFLDRFAAMSSSKPSPLVGGDGNAPLTAAIDGPEPVSSGTPLGVLQIPRIHLVAPLLEGTDDLTLNHAVGRIRGTASPGEVGNMGIAGHRDGIFRQLRAIKKGDAIELKTLKGKETYIVEQIRIVAPEDVSVLRPGATPSLTLVTCYPFYFIGSAPKRFIVRASLRQTTQGGLSGVDLRSPVTTRVTHKEK